MILRYLHTLRYLRPVQVFGRLRLLLPRPAVPADGLPAKRGGGAGWRQTPLRRPAMQGLARFRFLNETGELGDADGWNDPAREKLWLYQLHYFDDLNAEGAEGRKAWHEALIGRWVAENPPGGGNGWEPYPLARRIVNWVKWAWAGNALPAGAAESLALQARWLRRNLEWHLLGNHLLADAKGLVFAGLFFEGPEAEEWLTRGAQLLAREIDVQTLPDGGHIERSPMYHAQVLEDLLDVLHACRNKKLGTDPNLQGRATNGGMIPISQKNRVTDTIFQEGGSEKSVTDPIKSGTAPNLQGQANSGGMLPISQKNRVTDTIFQEGGSEKSVTDPIKSGTDTHDLIPADAGIQPGLVPGLRRDGVWTPAFAGVTDEAGSGTDPTKLGTDPDSPDLVPLEGICFEAAGRMLRWLEAMTHPDGGIALFNDAAFGETAESAALAAYAASLGIRKPSAKKSGAGPDPGARASQAFDGTVPEKSGTIPKLSPRFTRLVETGYVRVDWGEMTAFLDVAPIGPDWLPGHAHADTLGFELSLGRQRVIVDSGCSRYGEGDERLRQRGTAAHNTVTIDGQDSSEVWGGFRVARRAYPRDLVIRDQSGPIADWIAAEVAVSPLVVSCAHDGYRWLKGKPVHRREWRFHEGGLQIRDTIEGNFRNAVGRLHFHPDVRLIPASDACDAGRILLPDGRVILWKIERGRGQLTDTTWHPEFGHSIPNRCLAVHFTDRETLIKLSWPASS